MSEIKPFYVSLTKDLLGYYLKIEADSEETVRLYLEREYGQGGNKPFIKWELPWCSIYTADQVFKEYNQPVSIIDAKCGKLTKEQFTI
jgi:hypothetical protein